MQPEQHRVSLDVTLLVAVIYCCCWIEFDVFVVVVTVAVVFVAYILWSVG